MADNIEIYTEMYKNMKEKLEQGSFEDFIIELRYNIAKGFPVDFKSEEYPETLMVLCIDEVYTAVRHNISAEEAEKAISELIDSGADVNQRTSTGRTVLHELSHFEYSAEIFAKAIYKGADPTVTDNNGHTVWDEGEIWGWGIIDNEESDRKIALLSAFAEIEKNEGK